MELVLRMDRLELHLNGPVIGTQIFIGERKKRRRNRATRPISSRRSFTLRVRSRSLVPTVPAIVVILRMMRVSTRTPSPSKVLSVG